MIKYIILSIILIYLFNSIETFYPSNPKIPIHPLTYLARTDENINRTKTDPPPVIQCCKVYEDQDKDGQFLYKYEKLSGNQCNPLHSNYPQLNKIDYYYVGAMNWGNTNEKCSSDYRDDDNKQSLGSCRYNNEICQNFQTPKQCKKLGVFSWIWSPKPCNSPLDFSNKYTPYIHQLLETI
jgi:hypothetical protein